MNKDIQIQIQIREIYTAFNGTTGLYALWAKKNGLTYDSLCILYAVYYEEGESCQSKICDKWSLPKQTASSILREYERKGYIICRPNEKDRRNKMIQLTKEGVAYAEPILKNLHLMETIVCEKMDNNLRQAMVEGINSFFCCLKEVMEEENII